MSNSIWIHESVASLFKVLQEKLGNHIPIIEVYRDKLPRAPASLHLPTLYPELKVPEAKDGNWGDVARGIAHLISVVDGVPELRSSSPMEPNSTIAQQLNAELQIIACVQENLQPKPSWSVDGVEGLISMILNPPPGTPDAQFKFRLLQFYRLMADQHPEAPAAYDSLTRQYPEQVAEAENVFNQMLKEDLRSPAGKANSVLLLLNYLELNSHDFYLQSSRYSPGVFNDRSLAYYPTIKSIREQFETLRPSPSSWLKYNLPFALPILEGIYESDGLILLVQHARLTNPRAGWKAEQGTRVESVVSPSGLYSHSMIECWLKGEHAIEQIQPPSDILYKNIETYPSVLKIVLSKINSFITGLRASLGRSDIPEVLPADLNQLALKQFDADGNLIRKIPSLNLEFVRVSTGAPKIENEVQTSPVKVDSVSFARELLESAKYHVLAHNVRRAVLDFAGAYEAFIADVVTPKIKDAHENTKKQFLKRYSQKLSEQTIDEIKSINLPTDQDPERVIPIERQLKIYKRMGLKPQIHNHHLKPIRAVMARRNDAAHGKSVPDDFLTTVIAGIDALENLLVTNT